MKSPQHSLVIGTFEDPGFRPEIWDGLLEAGPSRSVFQTWAWQCSWWQVFGRGHLILMRTDLDGGPALIAPLFSDGGMVFFVGSGGSDYLDFVGQIPDASVLAAMLQAARRAVPDFVGFRFYHILDGSPTVGLLREAAEHLNLAFYEEGSLGAPALDLTSPAERTRALNKKSLVRHENYFRRNGILKLDQLRDAGSILLHLESFFQQHITRWQATPYPSLFLDSRQQHFYRTVTNNAAPCGWLRFSRLQWEGQTVAYHYGFCHQGSYLWYKPSFAIELANRSPGEVLLRQLIEAAIAECSHTFDFGMGEEPFKNRFATETRYIRTYGLYPR